LLGKGAAFLEEVVYWLECDQETNLAVIPYAFSRLVIADIDEVELLDIELPTPTVISGRAGGGSHLYFSYERDVPMTKTAWGHINPNYVLLPGSLHPSGRRYEWQSGLSPEQVPLMTFEEAAPILGVDSLLA